MAEDDEASGAAIACLKLLLTFFNFCFWVCGIVILGVGIWMLIDLNKYVDVSREFAVSVPYIFIGTGGFTILLGSFACCCTFKPQPVLLYIYSFFLLLVFIIVLAAGISAYAYRSKFVRGFQDGLRNGLQHYGTDEDKTTAIDVIQSTLRCCGVNSTADWNSTPYGHSHGANYPTSCCARTDSVKCISVYDQGCYLVVMSFVNSNITIIAGIAIGIAAFQIIGITLACILAKNAKRCQYIQV